MKRVVILIVVLGFSLTSFAEKGKVTREVIVDNKTVEIVRLTYPVGTESGMHSHKYPSRALIVVKGGKLKLVPSDENKPQDVVNLTDGQAFYLPSKTHNVINIGTSEVVIVEVEIK